MRDQSARPSSTASPLSASSRSKAAGGQTETALRGYWELIDYWERTGGWTQQWTTLRNVADLLDRLDDHDTASLLRAAADEAPEAASVAPADLQAVIGRRGRPSIGRRHLDPPRRRP